MRLALSVALALAAAPAFAQLSPEQTQGYNVILPIFTEVSPQDGGVLAACVAAVAQPAEVQQMIAAGAPNQALGALVSEIVARPEAIRCIQATLGR